MIEPKFKENDYIISHASGDMAIVKGISKKGYYQFKQYYSDMFRELKNLKQYNYELQINYQKFWELCNEEEKNKLLKIIENETKRNKSN